MSHKSLMRVAFLLAVPALFLAGCKVSSDGEPSQPDQQKTSPEAGAVKNADVGPPAPFDVTALPVSNVPLGAFPYFTLPAGYTTEDMSGGTLDYARFPFWVKGGEHWVEGKMFQSGFKAVPGKTFSIFEVVKNFDNAVTQLDGQKVSEETIPGEFRQAWPSETRDTFYYPVYKAISNPAHVWVIRRNDGNIWIYLAGDSAAGGYVIAQEAALTQSSQIIPAAALKQAIDTTGKVSLAVNFATDKTDILPASLPQIDQVVTLLTNDPALKLAVGGHTDNTGDKAHNQTLSEGRARSVVTAITAKGIPANRLIAKGYGDAKPVADNGTEDGKAQNRRVELVKM